MDLTITKSNVQDVDVAVNSTSVTVQQSNSLLVEVTPQQRIEINIDRAVTSNGIPAGGLTGQVLSKASDESYDAEWVSLEGGGDVIGANSSMNNNLVAFNGTTGKIIKDSGVSASSFATSAQGVLADTAVQPSDLSNVAFSGDYDDLIDKPTLGTIASQNANNVAITGGSITGITDLAVADGGTGASTASGARTNLSAAMLGANTDITSLGGITGGISTPDFLQLDTAAAASIAVAKLRWNVDTATAAFGIVDGTDEINIGEQMFAYVTNAESVAITRGQAVYLYQAQGNRATVKLASNLGDATSAKTLGLVAQDSIGANQTGFIITQGVVSKINTSAFAEGATLYLGATAGSLTSTKPKAPNHLVYIGVVERSNAGNGQIYVKPQNGYELDEIHDVQINSPANGQTIIYDQSTSLWKNANLIAGTGMSVSNGAGSITLTNTAPDQVVSLTAGSNVNITGTYPSFTISATGGGGGSGTVSSVALSLPSEFNVSGSPITTSGTLTGAWANQSANYIFAAPNGSSGTPTFRSLVSADIPALNYVSSVSGSGVISSSGGLSPTISISQASASTDGYLSSTDWNTFNSKGTVSNVSASAGTGISISGSPITSSGTLTITNTAPDQTVVLNSGAGISASGTYPNFTITNTAPDQTVSLTAGSGINVTGTYPAFTIAATASSANIQEFTTAGTSTWTKPSGAKFVYVLCQGGGGGGGSGHKQLASPTQPNQGGQGGAGGGWMDAIIPADLLGSTETVTVATGGTGGASKTTSGNGVDGTSGGNSSFGSWCIGRGGNGGTGGATATQGSGSIAASVANNILISQQSTGATTTVFSGNGGGRTAGTAGGAGGNGGKNAGGGGGGGGLANPAVAALAGGNGGSGGAGVIASSNTLSGSGGAGGTAGGNGTAGANTTNDYLGAAGGGGGSSSITANGGSGANGGYPAGGGGGGGSCLSSFNSGAGGNGGDGYVLVITVF